MIPLVTAQVVAFWVLAPLCVLGALGMVLCRKPVHSALSLAGMMVALGCLYASLDAPFLFVAQIIVYTGAVMMLFLFTMMIIGIDSVDSLVETIKGHKVLTLLIGLLFAASLLILVGSGLTKMKQGVAGADAAGNVETLAQIVFGPYVFVFLATSALLMIGAFAAIVLAHGEKLHKAETQAERAVRRTREFMTKGGNVGPLPGPGVYARRNSIEAPALLPDGSVSEASVSPTLAVRGMAIVESEGLREAHHVALQSWAKPTDELRGTDELSVIDQALTDENVDADEAVAELSAEAPETEAKES